MEFEGEYKNGEKWNGKGYNENKKIIYELINGSGNIKKFDLDHCILIYEGEYLNGKKNGKGKSYWSHGQLCYEGEYLDDKRHGKGKSYYPNGVLLYEGEYLDDKRHGKGKEYNDKGNLYFEGDYLNGEAI